MFVHRKGCHPKDRGRPVGGKTYREKVLKGFRAQRLEANPPVKFHETLKKSKLKTFSELNEKVKFTSKTANEIILKADRAHFWSNGYNCRKQTTSHERCPLSSVGTSSLGTIHSRWVTTENQQSSTSTGAVKEYILRNYNGKKDPCALVESNNIRLLLV